MLSLPFASLLTAVIAQAAATPATSDPYPASTALAEGVSPVALDELDALVQSLVDEEEVVGAELLVIKNDRTLFHEAYGWSDRESDRPMETGSLFCVRSMTKPLIGTAILMLVQDGVIELDDPVASHLPEFDVDGSRAITIEHLLQHESGLPMSLILAADLHELEAQGGIRAVAALGAGQALDFEPGDGFQYSDQGTDTLTAVIEAVSGTSAAEFVRERILEPLAMSSARTVLAQDDPIRGIAVSKYVGSRGSWNRFWKTDDPPLFPFFLGSQGLYATLTDYANFLRFWMHRGRGPEGRLLSSRFVRAALRPSDHGKRLPTAFPGAAGDYGQLMQLWTAEAEDGDTEVFGFGHTGSDGTHAWAFPEHDAMVLFFTQSRGTPTGLRVEEAVARLFLGAPFDPNELAPPHEDYLGFYWEGEGDLYRAIVRDGDDLALEILGKAIVPLTYAGDDRWKFRPNPSVVLAFTRDESGNVTGYSIDDHHELRFLPSAELPSGTDVGEQVRRAHRMERLESSGPIRMDAGLSIEQPELTGDVTVTLAWPDRYRSDTQAGPAFETLVHDGERTVYASTASPAKALDDARSHEALASSPWVVFGDWANHFGELTAIQELEFDGRPVIAVRAGDATRPAPTFFVERETGRVLRMDQVVHLDAMGRMGQRVLFDDFREVGGAWLPYRTRVDLAHPLIGTATTTVHDVELGFELAGDAFELAD